MKANSIIFAITIIMLLITNTYQCHYSCKNCTSQFYSDCLACSDLSLPTKLKENSSKGVCITNMSSNANVFGIFFFLLVLLACVILASQQIFYFAFFFQTISLMYILQVSWIYGVDYILSGLNYLMIFSRISFAYKQSDYLSTNEDMFKSNKLFKTTNLIINIGMIGITNLILFVIMFIIPIFKAFRTRINSQRVNCLPNKSLDKILSGVRTFFLMIIQQTVLTIYFSLTYGKNQPADYIIAIIYFACLTYFVVNQWINPFPYFRGKFAQLNILLSKIIIPIFMVLSSKYQFIVFIFIEVFLILDLVITNKNRYKDKINKLLLYKIFGLVTVLGLMVNFIVEIQINNQRTSSIIGYLAIAILGFHLHLFGLEIFFQWREALQKKKVENLQKSNKKIFSQNKDVTMLQIDNKQSITQQLELNVNNLNIDQIKPQMDKPINYQIANINQNINKRRKNEVKKQDNSCQAKIQVQKQESNIIQPKQYIECLVFKINHQKQRIDLQGEPESKEQNYVPTLFVQNSEL